MTHLAPPLIKVDELHHPLLLQPVDRQLLVCVRPHLPLRAALAASADPASDLGTETMLVLRTGKKSYHLVRVV